jgi:phage regulator Rha-like protein
VRESLANLRTAQADQHRVVQAIRQHTHPLAKRSSRKSKTSQNHLAGQRSRHHR